MRTFFRQDPDWFPVLEREGDTKKARTAFCMIAFLLALLYSGNTCAQQPKSLYFSNEFKQNASTMTESTRFSIDDPLYLVLNLSHTKNSLGDLTSVDPATGKRNFWLCLSPSQSDQTAGIKRKCVGIFPEPLDSSLLSSKAVAYKILPGGTEDASSTVLGSEVLSFLRYNQRMSTASIPFTYFIYGRSDRELNAGEAVYSMANWNTSARAKPLIDAQKRAEADEVTNKKAALTAWVKSLVSKRQDPALEKAIKASDPSPIPFLVFLQPTYDIIRNDIGVVLRKTIQTLYVYKWAQNGKCFAHWSSFGYESLGGGAFNSDLGRWNVMYGKTGYSSGILIPGVKDYYFYSGSNQEVECLPFTGK